MGERDLTSSALEDVSNSIQKDLNPFIETEKIRVRYLDEEGWDTALDFQKEMNISSSDAIHLAVAYIWGCDIFVTSDNQLRKIASQYFNSEEIVFADPSEILQKKEELKKARIEAREKERKTRK